MRTAIFLGLLFIAYAIDRSVLYGDRNTPVIALFIALMIAADVIDVIKKLNE